MIKSESPHSIADFWQSPPNALFPRAAVAKVLGKSVSWLERKALDGDGPAFCKLDRHALYSKQDVVDFIEKTASPRVHSTSELRTKAAAQVENSRKARA